MMATGEFARENDFSGPVYPTVFGITFTPTVSGILAAVIGVGLAGYAGTQLVGPKYAEFQETRDRVEQKKEDLSQKEETVKRVKDIEASVLLAQRQNREVRGLFSDQRSIDTLLLDLNRVIVASNAQLLTFKPDYGLSGVVTDSSLGAPLDNKIKRQVTAVSFQGTFNQTLQIMQSIDRLQTVLVVRDLSMELQQGTKPGEPRNIVKSTFSLHAYVPLTAEEMAAAASAQQTQPPAGTPPAETPPAGAPN
ncbi:MAG: pilus assembly protein PilO [Acaryochloridaceae cyanobacterium SU_2_1]|nr:pilus assembly protein PilO [Acaryochloridaceae cyanobacterium SU_2_1]